MIKLKNFINPKNNKDINEYNVTDFDAKDGWHWKEVDHLIEMGFQIEGDYRLKLVDKGDFTETLNVEIYKNKSNNDYVMELNGRKYIFNNFNSLINHIEEKQIN